MSGAETAARSIDFTRYIRDNLRNENVVVEYLAEIVQLLLQPAFEWSEELVKSSIAAIDQPTTAHGDHVYPRLLTLETQALSAESPQLVTAKNVSNGLI